MNEFGKRLKEQRKRAGLTQAEAANLAGMSRSRYAELEKSGTPFAEMLPKLARAVGCDVGDLFAGANTISPKAVPIGPDGCLMGGQSENQPSPEPESVNALCNGLVYCGTCGAAMDADHEGMFYTCAGRCEHSAIRVDVLNRVAIDYVNAVLKPEVREQLLEAVEDAIKAYSRARKKGMDLWTEEAKKLAEAVERFSPNEALSEHERSLMLTASESLKNLNTTDMLLWEVNATRQKWRGAVEGYFSGSAPLKPDDPISKQREMVHRYIEELTVYPTEIKIACTFDYYMTQEPGLGHWTHWNGIGIKTVSADGFEGAQDDDDNSRDCLALQGRNGKKTEAIGSRIKAIRVAKKMPAQELAVKSGCSRSTIVKLEAGRREKVIHKYLRIAKALDCRIDDLFPEMDEAATDTESKTVSADGFEQKESAQ